MNNFNTNPPQPNDEDADYAIIKAGLSSIPIIGGPAAELFSAIIIPPLARRRDAWLQLLAEGIKELNEKFTGFNIESLINNEVFVTAVMHATQAALRNHLNEKRDALRNAVLNVAAGKAPDEDLQLMFLDFIDTATSWHLRLLSFFENPQEYARAHGISLVNVVSVSQAISQTFKELAGKQSFYKQIDRDLYTRGFISSDDSTLQTMMTQAGAVSKRTTDLGDKFLKFIAAPFL